MGAGASKMGATTAAAVAGTSVASTSTVPRLPQRRSSSMPFRAPQPPRPQ